MTWFASFLRDAFALEISGDYRPFRDIASANLSVLLARETGRAEREAIDHVLHGFTELNPHDDVASAMTALRQAGIRIATLTNGSAKVTTALMERAGIRQFVEHVISIDEIGHWKPHAAVYQSCVEKFGLHPTEVILIAAHAWDIQGARQSGLMTAYVARGGIPLSPAITAPDLEEDSLTEVVGKVIGMKSPNPI